MSSSSAFSFGRLFRFPQSLTCDIHSLELLKWKLQKNVFAQTRFTGSIHPGAWVNSHKKVMWRKCSDFRWISCYIRVLDPSLLWELQCFMSAKVFCCISPLPLLQVQCQKHKLWMATITLLSLNPLLLLFFPSLRSLSFIHCHHSFSSRSQTCLLYVIFSFSILTFLVWQENKRWKGETHKHWMVLTLMMEMLKKKNYTHWRCNHSSVSVYWFSFIYFVYHKSVFILYAFWETYCTCFTDHCLVK